MVLDTAFFDAIGSLNLDGRWSGPNLLWYMDKVSSDNFEVGALDLSVQHTLRMLHIHTKYVEPLVRTYVLRMGTFSPGGACAPR